MAFNDFNNLIGFPTFEIHSTCALRTIQEIQFRVCFGHFHKENIGPAMALTDLEKNELLGKQGLVYYKPTRLKTNTKRLLGVHTKMAKKGSSKIVSIFGFSRMGNQTDVAGILGVVGTQTVL